MKVASALTCARSWRLVNPAKADSSAVPEEPHVEGQEPREDEQRDAGGGAGQTRCGSLASTETNGGCKRVDKDRVGAAYTQGPD